MPSVSAHSHVVDKASTAERKVQLSSVDIMGSSDYTEGDADVEPDQPSAKGDSGSFGWFDLAFRHLVVASADSGEPALVVTVQLRALGRFGSSKTRS